MTDLAIKEASQLFEVSHMTIRRWIDKGVLEKGDSQYITVKRDCVERLLKDKKFMDKIKRDHKPKEDRDNLQFQELLRVQKELLQNQRVILQEIADIKKTISDNKKIAQRDFAYIENKTKEVDDRQAETKFIEQKENIELRDLLMMSDDEEKEFIEHAKLYIMKTIEMGFSRKEIDPVSGGSNLIRWLNGRNINPKATTVKRWYNKAKELQGDGL